MYKRQATAPLSTYANASAADYFNLTKPTITLLVVVTAVPGLLIGTETLPSMALLISTLLGTALVSSSAAVFNQVIESDLDHKMERTRKRKIPSGKISTLAGSIFGFVLGFLGLLILFLGTNKMAALIALAGHLFYVVIYTMILKNRTPQNIVIGGAAGATGPLIGYAAVHGALGIEAWLLFLVITFWTPPHFWALALKYKEDYARAGVPMYPVVYGDHLTRRAMLLYSLLLLPCIIALHLLGSGGLFFVSCSLVLTGKLCWDAIKLYWSKNNIYAMPLFHFSCLYTFAVFAALTVDRVVALS